MSHTRVSVDIRTWERLVSIDGLKGSIFFCMVGLWGREDTPGPGHKEIRVSYLPKNYFLWVDGDGGIRLAYVRSDHRDLPDALDNHVPGDEVSAFIDAFTGLLGFPVGRQGY